MDAPSAPAAAALRADADAWDRFVAASPRGAYLQLSAWAQVKAVNGWWAQRVVIDTPAGPLGGQLLVHRVAGTPWAVGYMPRGPLAPDDAGATEVAAFTGALRALARSERLSHVTIDPEVEEGSPLADHLATAGWRPTGHVQPDRTRVIDLGRPEAELWSELRKKWRQYVNGAQRAGVEVREADGSALDDFYAILADTGRRAGFIHRAPSAYRDVWEAYASRGLARLLFAELADGTRAAVLMLLGCGRRVVEPYGGMTDAGAAARANYLLKWEAIRSSNAAGFGVYDMWGLANPGIEHFKAGFGGREVPRD